MISVLWVDLTARTIGLIPWWVGPIHRSRTGHRLYWTPVTDLVAKRVDAAVDRLDWFSGGKLAGVEILLSRPGLVSCTPGWHGIYDSTATYDVSIDDEHAESRDLDAVVSWLHKSVLTALDEIARRTGRPALALDAVTTTAAPEADHPDRLARIASTELGPGGPLCLVPPASAARRWVAEMFAGSREVPTSLHGWKAYRVDHGQTGERRGDDPLHDFSALDLPARASTLALDPRNSVIVLAQDREQRAAAIGAVSVRGLRLQARVVGRDGGSHWAACGLTG